MNARRRGPGLALAAAALFGLSAPAAKLLAGTVDPWLLAGLLYLGSGIGLGLYRLVQRRLGLVGQKLRSGGRISRGSARPSPPVASSARYC